jgi:hypothetical protein
MERIAYAYESLVRKPEGKAPLSRCRYEWEDNIKIVGRH